MILRIVAIVSERHASPSHVNTQLTQRQNKRTQLVIKWASNIFMEFAIIKEQKETSDGREPEERSRDTT